MAPGFLDDPAQRSTLAERLSLAEAMADADPRPARPPLPVGHGPFWRGTEEPAGLYSEWPRRRLVLTAFAIDPYPVTVRQYGRFVEAGGYVRRELWSDEGWAFLEAAAGGRIASPRFWGEAEWAAYLTPNRPVVGVSHHEASACARFLDRRLPTEAEWEKAARGDDGREFPWGDTFEADRCHSRGGHRGTLPVGCFPAGRAPCGAFDLAGNVWEWCADWYEPRYYVSAPDRDPRGPDRGELRVARGGGWNAMPGQLRCANRNAWPPGARFSNLGFRLAG